MVQTIFTVITRVKPPEFDALHQVVAAIGADPAANAVLPFGGFDTLHFASLVLVEADRLPPTMVFEHNVDGSADDWLRTLVAEAGDGLDALYRHCVGYPGSADREKVRDYLAGHIVRPGAFHVGATGRSLARIRQEADLRAAVETYVDAQREAGTLPADVVGCRSAIQDFVRTTPGLAWATAKAPPRQTRTERWGHQARLRGAQLAAVPLAILLLPVLLLALVVLRRKEKRDPVQEGSAGPEQIEALSRTEDFVAQNHLASVIAVKPGPLRGIILPVVLYALNLIARVSGTKGKLAGIPSIHFAHWSRINGGSHLMFLSNFNGSWESYLGDFIEKGAPGLSAVWSNTVEYPRTEFLVRKGATDGPRFRQWARAHQCPTQAWYSAYPGLTMSIIDNNSAMREGLFGSMTTEEATTWLRRL